MISIFAQCPEKSGFEPFEGDPDTCADIVSGLLKVDLWPGSSRTKMRPLCPQMVIEVQNTTFPDMKSHFVQKKFRNSLEPESFLGFKPFLSHSAKLQYPQAFAKSVFTNGLKLRSFVNLVFPNALSRTDEPGQAANMAATIPRAQGKQEAQPKHQ